VPDWTIAYCVSEFASKPASRAASNTTEVFAVGCQLTARLPVRPEKSEVAMTLLVCFV
jgi:hypothetical protein